MWSQDAVIAGGGKSEYGRNERVLEFPGSGRAALPAGKIRAPPDGQGSGDPLLTVHSRTWRSQDGVSSQVVVYEQVGPENQKWLRDYEGKDRTVRGSFQDLGEVCSPSSARGVAQSPPSSGSWKPRPLRDELIVSCGPTCVFRHENRMIHLRGRTVCLSNV